nr:phosphate ABC transporter ATP-binding protein [uncultured Desulfobulbus sp.]
MTPSIPAVSTHQLSFRYGGAPILEGVDLELPAQHIIAITGPSGIGKSTLLSLLNRLWEEQGEGHIEGQVKLRLDGKMVDIYHDGYPLDRLRRKVGMVFQTPNPLPMSIAQNLAFPMRLMQIKDRQRIAAKSEEMLRKVHLFDEVRDRLQASATQLSGGQQQRLCIARSLMLEPEILLLDEPTSSLDQQGCLRIEELLQELRSSTTILMVSHYQDQVQRIADQCYTLQDSRLNRIM